MRFSKGEGNRAVFIATGEYQNDCEEWEVESLFFPHVGVVHFIYSFFVADRAVPV